MFIYDYSNFSNYFFSQRTFPFLYQLLLLPCSTEVSPLSLVRSVNKKIQLRLIMFDISQRKKHYFCINVAQGSNFITLDILFTKAGYSKNIWSLFCQQWPYHYQCWMGYGLSNTGHIDGLVQKRHNSTALAMELHLSCTNLSIWKWYCILNIYCPV